MPISNMNLASKRAVVSGASRGLGKAISQALVTEGAEVYGLARSTSALEDLAMQLGSSFHPVVMDITDSDAVRRWVKESFHQEFAPHILINNAGRGVFGKIEELPLEKWKQMIDTNLHKNAAETHSSLEYDVLLYRAYLFRFKAQLIGSAVGG